MFTRKLKPTNERCTILKNRGTIFGHDVNSHKRAHTNYTSVHFIVSVQIPSLTEITVRHPAIEYFSAFTQGSEEPQSAIDHEVMPLFPGWLLCGALHSPAFAKPTGKFLQRVKSRCHDFAGVILWMRNFRVNGYTL